jgi:hypothetical protein
LLSFVIITYLSILNIFPGIRNCVYND